MSLLFERGEILKDVFFFGLKNGSIFYFSVTKILIRFSIQFTLLFCYYSTKKLSTHVDSFH